MAKKKTKKEVKKKQDDSKLFAFLAVFFTIVGFIIAIVAKKDDKYVMFYAKQGLVLFIAWLIGAAIAIVPIAGWIASPVIYVLTFVLWIIGWINALSGEQKRLWIISDFADKIKL